MTLLIAGGTVLTPAGWTRSDVFIVGERTVSFESPGGVTDVVDASGCLVGPGFVDVHTHLREPGQTWKEDIASGSKAAAAGGYTAIVAMPNTDPPMDHPKVVETVLAAGLEADAVEVLASAALSLGRSGVQAVDVDSLYRAGVRLFTDDGDSLLDTELLSQLMKTIATYEDAVLAQHAEDHGRTKDGHMHGGEVSQRLGVGGLSSAAESDIVARDLELVEETGVRYHCQHVSAASTVELIRGAKRRGLPVTAEVTPHHLCFTDEDLAGLDTNLKMYPPLRTELDRQALVAALAEGTIDMVATDHAPHTTGEKSVAFVEAPRGVIGLETAGAAVWEKLGDPTRFFTVMSMSPARLIGSATQGTEVAPGRPANLVVFDPEQRWVPESFHSKASNSPYLGIELQGKVRATVRDGRVIYAEGGAV